MIVDTTRVIKRGLAIFRAEDRNDARYRISHSSAGNKEQFNGVEKIFVV